MISPPASEMHAGDAEYLGQLKEDRQLLEGVQVTVGVWVAEADEAGVVVNLLQPDLALLHHGGKQVLRVGLVGGRG